MAENSNLNDLHESFNKMKKTLYTTSYDIKKYEYVDITNLIVKENKTEEEWKTLEKFYHLIETLRLVVEDIGTQILRVQEINFENKRDLEIFSKDVIELIDKFIDTLVAINENFNFSSDDIDTRMSEYHLKSLRSNFIKRVNEFRFKFDVNIEQSEINKIKTLINDILDDIIKETISLRVDRLSQILKKQFDE